MSDISYNENIITANSGDALGFVPIEISAPMVDMSLLEGRYSESFVDMIAAAITPEIEELVSVEGLVSSGVGLHLVFASDTYMEHTSESVTYRRLLISYGQGAPRDLWVKWTRLDGSGEGYSLSDSPSPDSVKIEISEDVPQKIREKEYRFLARTSPEKYRAAIGKRNVTEWRELIKRAVKNGDLTRVEKPVEISEETAALADKLAAVLGISESEVSAPEVSVAEESSEDDIAALARAALGLDSEEPSVVSFDEPEEAEDESVSEVVDIFDLASEDEFFEDEDEEADEELFEEEVSETLYEEVEETEEDFAEEEPLFEEIPEETPDEPEEELSAFEESDGSDDAPVAEPVDDVAEDVPVSVTAAESADKEELEERIRAELEAKIRLEYESRARKQAEEEAERLRLAAEELRLENERLRREDEKRRAERAAEEERIRAELEIKLREESRERERIAEAAREALYERERLEAERAREAERREAEERAERERIERERERALEAERIRASMEERAAAPSEKKYNYTKKTVLLLFRRSVDPNVTARIHEIIKATVDYYGKSDVYIRIKASLPDSTTVRLDFVEIPVEEMELLTNIIKVLGNSGLGIAKAKIQ